MQQSSPWLPLAAGGCALALLSVVLASSDATGATRKAASGGTRARAEPGADAIPGGLVHWSAPGTRGCRMAGHTWQPIDETCYFPIDILQKPGIVTVTRVGAGKSQSARVKIEAHDYGTQEVELPDIPQKNPSKADLARAAREGHVIARVFQRREGPAQFKLPLGTPAKPLPPGKAFGVNRVFDGKPASQPHMGIDYLAGPGTPVLAVADGTIVLAQDLFHPGGAVFVDHGNGLVTMSFHLAEIGVKVGDVVKKGDTVGKVGTTGRSTGPHLYFGVRWHGARIDPKPLLEDPSKITPIR